MYTFLSRLILIACPFTVVVRAMDYDYVPIQKKTTYMIHVSDGTTIPVEIERRQQPPQQPQINAALLYANPIFNSLMPYHAAQLAQMTNHLFSKTKKSAPVLSDKELSVQLLVMQAQGDRQGIIDLISTYQATLSQAFSSANIQQLRAAIALIQATLE